MGSASLDGGWLIVGSPSTSEVEVVAMVALMGQLCARPGCGARAVLAMSYDYRGAIVWLEELASSHQAHGIALCTGHGERLSAPVGWRLERRHRPAHLRLAPSPNF